VQQLALTTIRIDGGTQSRVELSEAVVAEYASAITEGAELPPIVVFHDGSAHWLADGFHRFMAYTKLGRDTIPADVRTGTRRDAVLYSVGANSAHGLPRTNADKRRSVEMLLDDINPPCERGKHVAKCGCWEAWSDREIARHCRVHHTFVGGIRKSLSGVRHQIAPRKVERNGTVYTQNTANIGRRTDPVERVSLPAPTSRMEARSEPEVTHGRV